MIISSTASCIVLLAILRTSTGQFNLGGSYKAALNLFPSPLKPLTTQVEAGISAAAQVSNNLTHSIFTGGGVASNSKYGWFLDGMGQIDLGKLGMTAASWITLPVNSLKANLAASFALQGIMQHLNTPSLMKILRIEKVSSVKLKGDLGAIFDLRLLVGSTNCKKNGFNQPSSEGCEISKTEVSHSSNEFYSQSDHFHARLLASALLNGLKGRMVPRKCSTGTVHQ